MCHNLCQFETEPDDDDDFTQMMMQKVWFHAEDNINKNLGHELFRATPFSSHIYVGGKYL